MPKVDVKILFKNFDDGKLPWHIVKEKIVAKKTAYKYFSMWKFLNRYDSLVEYAHTHTIPSGLVKDLLNFAKRHRLKLGNVKRNNKYRHMIVCRICREIQRKCIIDGIPNKMVKDLDKILKDNRII